MEKCCCCCCCCFFFTRNVVLFHGRSTSTHVFLDHNGLTSAPHDKLITLFFFLLCFAHKQKIMNKLFRTTLLSGPTTARFSVGQKQN